MFRRRLVGLLLGALFVATSARAQEQGPSTHGLTFARAIELARRQAPELAIARARIEEARSGIDAASLWRFNPQLQASAGPRSSGADTTVDWSVGARQWFEVGGQRGDRIAAARAGVDAVEAQREDAERLLLREVGLAFVQALYWEQRVELARENLRIVEAVARVARRRHEVGATGGLEESVASLSFARSQIDEARALAALGQVEGRLKILLGFQASAEVDPQGDLRQLGAPLAATPKDVDTRPDLRVLDAEVRQAKSEIALGRAARVPNIRLGADYSREEGADIIQGSLALSIPLFDHGQGTTAVAQARRGRIEAELRGAERRVAVEVETASRTSRQLSAAARLFEERGLATLERSEDVATASYEAGAMPLGELLAIRRELVQAKLDYAGLLLGAATARVELSASTGSWK